MLTPSRPPSPAAARRALAATAAVVATFGLGACTAQQSSQSKNLSGAEGEVQKVLTNLGDRADDGDAKGICDKLLTTEVKDTFAVGGGCEATVKKAIAQADFVTLNVDTVEDRRRSGDRDARPHRPEADEGAPARAGALRGGQAVADRGVRQRRRDRRVAERDDACQLHAGRHHPVAPR